MQKEMHEPGSNEKLFSMFYGKKNYKKYMEIFSQEFTDKFLSSNDDEIFMQKTSRRKIFSWHAHKVSAGLFVICWGSKNSKNPECNDTRESNQVTATFIII